MFSVLHVSASKFNHKGGHIQVDTDVASLTDFTVFVFLRIKSPKL